MARPVPTSDGAVERELADIRRRLSALERPSPESFAFSDGTRIRVRAGKQDDGEYGIRVWDSSGTLVYDDTTA